MSHMGSLGIPVMPLNEREFFLQDYSFQLSRHYLNMLETNIGKDVVSCLSQDSRVQELEGKFLSKGGHSSLFDVTHLACWYLWYANECGGEKEAIEALNSFLGAEKVPILHVLFLQGLVVQESIRLKDGYEIIPLEKLPNSPLKALILQRRGQKSIGNESYPRSVLIRKSLSYKALSDIPPPDQSLSAEWATIQKTMGEIAFLVNAIHGIFCSPHLSASILAENVPTGPFGGHSYSLPIFDVSGRGETEILPDHAELLDKLVISFQSKERKEQERLIIILSRLSQAKGRANLADKILDLGITLEMLLLKNLPEDTQISLQFRLRGSWFLGNNKEERQSLCRELKDFYSLRSKVAHTGTLPYTEELPNKFDKYTNITERVLQKIIFEGEPDWNSLILGD